MKYRMYPATRKCLLLVGQQSEEPMLNVLSIYKVIAVKNNFEITFEKLPTLKGSKKQEH